MLLTSRTKIVLNAPGTDPLAATSPPSTPPRPIPARVRLRGFWRLPCLGAGHDEPVAIGSVNYYYHSYFCYCYSQPMERLKALASGRPALSSDPMAQPAWAQPPQLVASAAGTSTGDRSKLDWIPVTVSSKLNSLSFCPAPALCDSRLLAAGEQQPGDCVGRRCGHQGGGVRAGFELISARLSY